MEDISVRSVGMEIISSTGGAELKQFMSTPQGFAIKAVSGDPVMFTNALCVTGNNASLRTPMVAERLWLNVTNEEFALASNAGVFFSDLATDGFEGQSDSKGLGTNVSLHSQIEESDNGYTTQGRESFNTSLELPMGFSSRVAQENAV
jgi:hypothetical protein